MALVAAPAGAAELDDQDIADAIENELLFDPAVAVNDIDISVANGIVTLTGTTDNILARHRAERIAETVRGVKAVVNRITVDPPTERSDAAVRQDVLAALATDPATESYDLDISVDDGIVTLRGTADSWAERRLAGTVARGVRGVLGVINEVDVIATGDRPDSEIKAEVTQALHWDVLVDHGLIEVTVEDGKVMLSGTVGSAAEKRRARFDAWVGGVTEVDASALEVEPWARDEDLRPATDVAPSDERIEQALNTALIHDPRVLSLHVTPDVDDGVVTLRGNVNNLKAKRAAAQVARNTMGVARVVNRLKVRPDAMMSDAEIAVNIRQALRRDPYVERREVIVDVTGGTASLTGTVDSYFEKRQAQDAASRVNGVTRIRNNLDVSDPGPLAYDPYVYDDYFYGEPWYDYEPQVTFETDAQIADEINEELRWSPFVDGNDVTVTVMDGIATLTGMVDSWREYNAATENAYEGGAVWVDNDLTIQ
ncbi:MAG: BON domain-containing protein [Planctomycetota bacterium]